jgi:hypothetical protein
MLSLGEEQWESTRSTEHTIAKNETKRKDETTTPPTTTTFTVAKCFGQAATVKYTDIWMNTYKRHAENLPTLSIEAVTFGSIYIWL